MNTTCTFQRFASVFLLVGLSLTLQQKSIAQNNISITVSIKPETCYQSNDVELTVAAKGGIAPYRYSIAYNAGAVIVKNSTSNVFSNLKGGETYMITVQDSKGTEKSIWQHVAAVWNPINLRIDDVKNSSCEQPLSGYINSGASGGNGDIVFSIDNGAIFQKSGMFKNLAAGVYNIIAKDKNGCMSSIISATVGGSYSATLIGDTTVAPNAPFPLKVNIFDQSADKNTRYTITGKDNLGNMYEYPDLQVGPNERIFNTPVSVVFTILSVQKNNSSCKGYATGTATITVKEEYIWNGKTTDWHRAANWGANKVPTATGNVIIPKTKYNPVIKGAAFAKNISIEKGAALTVSGTLSYNGELTTADPNVVDAQNGTIELTGSVPQTLDGQVFRDHAIRNLNLGNTVSLSDSLNVFGQINFIPAKGQTVAKNFTFTTNDHLTLKSNAQGTATVGQIINGNRITGNVTVEHYLPARKGWKFISVATESDQTIHAAWQEGQKAGNTTDIKGYGIQLTGPGANWAANGFDRSSPAPSIKTHVTNTNLWTGVPSTLTPFSHPSNAYMVFVRGDRSAHEMSSPETETVLRTKGELKYGEQQTVEIPKDKFVAVGNPYAADLDISKIKKSNEDLFFYVWDQNLGNSYGGYQTFTNVGRGEYLVIPGGGSYANLPSNIIPAGQAFFVSNTLGGSIEISESSKAGASVAALSGRRFDEGMDRIAGADLKVRLYTVSVSDKRLVDGIYQRFDNTYNKDFDQFDAVKSANTGENLSVKKAGKLLAVDSRPFSENNDTTLLNITGMSYTTYQFEISYNQENDGYDAVLVDKYANTRTVLQRDQTVEYTFDVTNKAGSYAANRFEIIMVPKRVAPVTFTSVKAELKNEKVSVSWTIENEKNVASYQVERSADGSHFENAGNVKATGARFYNFADLNAGEGMNYYRVVSIDIDGKKGYSSIVKVDNKFVHRQSISVQPNPIAGNEVKMKLNLSANGVYYFSIRNQIGQVIDSRQMEWSGSETSFTWNPSAKLLPGVYSIEVVHPNGEHSVVRFIK